MANPHPVHKFKKGQSGNPSGNRRRIVSIAEMAKEHVPEALANLKRLGKGKGNAAYNANALLLAYAYGKPVESLLLAQAEMKRAQPTPFQIEARTMSNRELADRAIAMAQVLREVEDEPKPTIIEARFDDPKHDA